MTAIQSASSPSSTDALSAAGAATGATSAQDLSDRFLTLLVTQLRNQDPLNPLDNAEVTTQLAQISTVSGINKVNETLTALAASLGASQSLQATSVVGHTVLVEGNQLQLAGSAAAGGVNLSQDADHVVVTINDASGRAVRQLDLGAMQAGPQMFTWDGRTDSGTTASDGSYTMSVTATASGKSVAADPLASAKVLGLYPGKDGTLLDLGRLGRIDVSNVIEIN